MLNGNSQIRHVLVSVATFRRPQQLLALLRSLESQCVSTDRHIRVVVVDNDPGMSARSVCEQLIESPNFDLDVQYFSEPRPGISYARNEGLRHLGTADAVAFIDDDETAEPQWVEQLVQASELFSADVVAGPVIPKFPGDAPSWIVRQGWFERPCYRTGENPKWPATNNSLIRRSMLEKLPTPYFEPKYALTGGSDTYFYMRCRDHGAKVVWSANAEVTEEIPRSRLSARWLWRRNVRLGNVSGAMLGRRHSKTVVLCIGTGRILFGIGAGLLRLIFKPEGAAEVLAHTPRGFGVIAGLVGSNVIEYKRDASSGGIK